MNRKRHAAATAVIALMFPLGCASGDGSEAGSTMSGAPTPEQTAAVPATADSTPPVGVDVMPPVGIDEVVEFEPGVSARVTAVEDVEVEGVGASETSGPALAVTVEFVNDSDEPVDMVGLAVTAFLADGVPAISSRAEPADELVGLLGAADSATGVYVFRVADDRPELTVELSHSSFSKVLTFRV